MATSELEFVTIGKSNPNTNESGILHQKKEFFTVTGMTCAACSGTIERALLSTRGIQTAKISLLTERCEVIYDPTVITPKKIIDEIEDVGFEASVSSTGAKGKIALITNEHMSEEKKVVITKVIMEQVGVLNVNITSRAIPPYDDVLEVEFDQKQYDLCGPGGSKPVVWQGSAPAPTTSTSAADSLGRFSIRSLVQTLRTQHKMTIVTVRNDGDLEIRKSELKHRREQELSTWKKSFLQSLFFTIPIAVICWIMPWIPFVHEPLMTSLHKALTVKAFILWVLVTPVQFGFGWRFYRGSFKALKHRSANMDVLIALGSSASYFYSLIVCIMCLSNDHYVGNVFFETSALLISIVLLGRYVEHFAKGRTSEALSALMGLQASTATLLTLDPVTKAVIEEEEIDVNLVQQEDILHVHRGGKIPVDGIIISESMTSIDESFLTGESMPVSKGEGAKVIGGTINLEQPIRIRATGVGSETVLFKIVSLVNDAQNSKAPIQAYADYIGSIFVPTVVLLSFLVFLFWFTLCTVGVIPEDWKGEHENNFLFAFLFSVSVLLISCPCSLGLATPTAVMVGTGVGAGLGVLFKGGEPLEITGKANIVVFDKTGTLTVGKPSVSSEHTWITGLNRLKMDEQTWWLLVGSLAHQSEHLMSRAIATHAVELLQAANPNHKISPSNASSSSSSTTSTTVVLESVHDFLAQSGGGCGGRIQGHQIFLGNARWLQSNGISIDASIEARMDAVQTRGNVAVLVGMDGELSGVISLTDSIKPEAALTIRSLHSRGIEVFMLTGDNARAARAVGEMVGIPESHVISQVTPADKAEVIKQIQSRGEQAGSVSINVSPLPGSSLLGDSIHSSSTTASPMSDDDDPTPIRIRPELAPIVIFVGDGVNDAPPLAQSDVGIAIGSGTDIALETASVVLMKNDLCDVITAIDLSQATLKRIRRNFTWACIYNLLSIPIAAGILYPFVHQGLPPILAAACMGLSSTSVIVSSLLLKKYRPPILADETLGGGGQPNETQPNRLRSFFRPHEPAYTVVANPANGGSHQSSPQSSPQATPYTTVLPLLPSSSLASSPLDLGGASPESLYRAPSLMPTN